MDNYLFNYILVGSSENVGTNTLISKLLNNNMDDCKTIKIGNKIIKQLITDSKTYDKISPDYGRVQAFFIIFDLTNKQSFLNIDKIIKDLRLASWGDSLFIIVGNKSDIKDQRQVSFDEAKEYSNKIESQYFEISTKENNGINHIESMFYFASLISLTKKSIEEQSSNNSISKSIKEFEFYQDNVNKIKYLIIGDKFVGKSSLVSAVNENSNLIIDDEPGYINSFILDIENKKAAISIAEYNDISIPVPLNIDAIIMVIDLTNKESLVYLEQNYNQLLNNLNKKVLLVGNKNDSDKREVSFDEAKSFATNKLNCNYIEASFTKDFNVNEINQILFDITKDILKIVQINNQIKSIKKKKSQQKKDCIIC